MSLKYLEVSALRSPLEDEFLLANKECLYPVTRYLLGQRTKHSLRSSPRSRRKSFDPAAHRACLSRSLHSKAVITVDLYWCSLALGPWQSPRRWDLQRSHLIPHHARPSCLPGVFLDSAARTVDLSLSVFQSVCLLCNST